MSFRRALVVLVGFGLAAVGCVPGPGAAATDTLDLGSLGTFAEPAFTIEATTTVQVSPHGPRTSDLTIYARDPGDISIIETFQMREDNTFADVATAAPGEFPGLFAPPHTRVFNVSKGFSPAVGTLFGKVTITELETGDVIGGANGPVYQVTKLRASFSGVYDAYGKVEGYFTIG